MKKVFISLFVSLLCMQTISAQWSVGGKIGANWSRFVGDFSSHESKQKMGWNIGAVGNYAFNDWFEMQGELLYSRRGIVTNGSFDYGGNLLISPKFTYHYLDIPILIQFYPFKRAELFSIQAGIQPEVFLGQSIDDHEDLPRFVDEDTNPLGLGLIFGCAYKFKNGLFLDGRYVLSMTDHYKKEIYGEMKGRSMQLSIGYLFQFR